MVLLDNIRVEGIMIKLKNKPDGCSNCPFCYKEQRYRYREGGVEEYEKSYCGVARAEVDGKSCPLD